MNWTYLVVMAIFGLVMVGAQVLCANNDSFLTVQQMQARGFKNGLPLMWHAGIWGDFVILTPLLAYIVARYADQWYRADIIISLAIGIVAIIGFGFMWINGAKHGLPEAHTHGGHMTGAGFFHAIYFVVAIAVILLVFFHTEISQKAASVIAVILGIHVVYGTHIMLGLIAPPWYPDRPQSNPVTWAIVLVSWGLLAWRCFTIH